MIFRTIAITTVIAGIVLAEGVVITFMKNNNAVQKPIQKKTNEKTQTAVSKSSKK